MASREEFEKLSDFELHKKLIQYGLPNLPVTETTRNILIKKLINHVNNERNQHKKQQRASAKQAAPSHSPRESYLDYTRPVLAQQHAQVPQAERYSYGGGGGSSNSVYSNGGVSPLGHTKPSLVQGYGIGGSGGGGLIGGSNISGGGIVGVGGGNISHGIGLGIGGGNSRVANSLPEPMYGEKNIYMKRTTIGLGQMKGLMGTASQAPPTTINRSSMPQQRSPKMYAPPPILSSESDEESDYLNYSAVSSQSPATKLSAAPVRGSEQHPNPHVSVVNRLLSFRDFTLGAQQQQKQQQQHQSSPKPLVSRSFNVDNSSYRQALKSAVGGGSSRYTDDANISLWQMLVRLVRRPKQTVVPYVLLSALVLFLLVLTFMYVFISPDLLQSIDERNTQYTLCKEYEMQRHGHGGGGVVHDLPALRPNCIESDRLSEVLELNGELIRLLQARALQHHCSDHTVPAAVTATEFVRHLHSQGRPTVDLRKMLQNVMRIEHLIAQNPQWQIDAIGAERGDSAAAVTLPNQETKFVLLKPKLPLGCIFYNKVQRFFLIIGTGTLIVGVCSILYFGFCFVRSWKLERQVAIENFIRAIEHELVQRVAEAHTGEERVVIVNHLRDKLVPLSKRSALMWSWNEALRMLELNDSRIQFGVCMRNGEEFRTMQWIGGHAVGGSGSSSGSGSGSGSGSNTPTSSSEKPEFRDRTRTKQWQSPAFDNVNRILDPPTPCLKIRHMFDMSEVHNPQLKQIIKEAIVYKVGPRCNITDIQIDKQSCCVYVRCATTADAGIVHNEINGWWFDKRLVSIKFLRLERYLRRFPNSNGNNNNNMNYKGNNSSAYGLGIGGSGESSGDDFD